MSQLGTEVIGMSKTITSCSFQELIEAIEALPADDQELLIEIIHKRLTQQRWTRLLDEISEALSAYDRGEVRRGTVEDLMRTLEK